MANGKTNIFSRSRGFFKWNDGEGRKKPTPPGGGVQSVTGTAVDNTDPENPVINSTEIFEEINYSDLSILKAAESLIPGLFYKITDRGDQGIILQALSNSALSTKGVRFMNCPITYQTTGLFLGVWHSGLTPEAGEKVIWGGKVWTNTSGAVGTAIDDLTLNPAHYTVIAKPAYGLTSINYSVLQFNILYDFENDWIQKQWDEKGNIVGYRNSEIAVYYECVGFNPVDITDWNIDIDSWFYNNDVPGGFYNNVVEEFYNNKTEGAGIFRNYARYVFNNSTVGDKNHIKLNVMTQDIYDNKNTTGIFGNTGDNIYENSNCVISNNSNCLTIVRNVNCVINSNTDFVAISRNFDYGIEANTGSGLDAVINYNIPKDGNSTIKGNAIIGAIRYNNCRSIYKNTSVVPVNIEYNTNNGDIGTDAAPTVRVADITDAIVTK